MKYTITLGWIVILYFHNTYIMKETLHKIVF